jgi:Dihaem cytochrome c
MNIQTTLALIMTTTLGTAGLAVADKDSYALDQWKATPKTYLNKAEHEQYLKECGSCHFAYQPGLLPAASWERIMANLSDHFGDNAELPATETTDIRNYLLNNAAGRVNSSLPKKILRDSKAQQPVMRITETAYFIRKHDEIKPKMVKDNPEVRSFSRCDACHTRAADASYNEHEVKIPGYGRWED